MVNRMDKLHQLYIRACKSRHPEQRLQTLHRRFYMCKYTHQHTAQVLANIIDQYGITFKLAKFTQDSSEDSEQAYALYRGSEYCVDYCVNYWERVCDQLVNIIRYTKRDDLPPQLTIPRKFRTDA